MLELAEPNSNGVWCYKVRCDCGTEKIVGSYYLYRGKGGLKSCGCLQRESIRKNEVGKKFGLLTVIREVAKRGNGGSILWECQCDCGNVALVVGTQLRAGTKSCGCLRHLPGRTRGAPGQAGLTTLYLSYKGGAKSRGLSFELTLDEFRRLTSSSCFYCGVKPSNKQYSYRKPISEEAREHTLYVFNGIDRIDNDIGYIFQNCVPCCEICNKAKHALTINEFLSWIARLVEYQSIQEVEEDEECLEAA